MAVSKPGRFPGEARILLADAYRKQKKYDKAAIMYEQALASRPDDKSIYHLIGDLYRIQGLFDKAIDIIKRALRIWPT
ncbi:tetratricopeptide repeat protein, partial [Escherichia coli]|nr:tetratricopeptide repeat protein [Escherichia coli]